MAVLTCVSACFQVAEAAAAKKRRLEEEERLNQAELDLALSRGILSENPDDAKSALGPNRIRPDHYRGMSPTEAAKYRELQAEQRREVQRRKAAEREADREEARRQADILRAAARIEAAQAEEARKAAAQYKASLDHQRMHRQAMARKARQEELEPAFTDGFFSGFGQSDR